MANEYEETGRHGILSPNRTRALMVLVAVITGIAIWLVPVDDKEAPPSLPPLPSAPDTAGELSPSSPAGMTTEELPLPSPAAGEPPLPAAADSTTGELPQPSTADTGVEIPVASAADTTEKLSLPPPPGGIATVTTGGDKARAFIYELQTEGGETDADAVFAEAERMQGEGDLEDAYLLYRYAARHGQVQAALLLGTRADPAFHATANSYLPDPEPAQAYKWYSLAEAAGNDEAAQRLTDLRRRVQQDAAAGDEQARRLLLQWR